jgi:hypothetical protein
MAGASVSRGADRKSFEFLTLTLRLGHHPSTGRSSQASGPPAGPLEPQGTELGFTALPSSCNLPVPVGSFGITGGCPPAATGSGASSSEAQSQLSLRSGQPQAPSQPDSEATRIMSSVSSSSEDSPMRRLPACQWGSASASAPPTARYDVVPVCG